MWKRRLELLVDRLNDYGATVFHASEGIASHVAVALKAPWKELHC